MLPRILLATLASALVAAAFVPGASAIPEPEVPCYPDFYGGTVCVIGGDRVPCVMLVSYNPDDRHPHYPANVTPLYCSDGDTYQQMTPCLPGYLDLADPYCWTDYPDDP